ncbi:MAG: tryptophan synthase subunit alpha [Spirosomataceae bacterium]
MENRITQLFAQKRQNILNIYFTAGFPQLNDTQTILLSLQEAGADLIEIGIPYSDPVADGETIQKSSQKALENGMTLKSLFEQLKSMREDITIPVLLMGYINPVLQYGIENFCKKCQEIGIDGLILPDIPLEVYQEEFKPIFEKYELLNIFLITPQTSDNRIRQIDALSRGFIYMVSSASVTGAKSGISHEQEKYFERIDALNLENPRLIGFGISDHKTFVQACQSAQGAIIGSAFIKHLETTNSQNMKDSIREFVKNIKKNL